MSRWSVLLGATLTLSALSFASSGCHKGGADNLGTFVPPVTLATITSVIPNSGSILGSNSITIIGSNFAIGATARVGNTTLISIAQPNTFTLTGIIPTGNYPPGPADVSVITSTQTATLRGGYTFEDMTFTSITPNNGPITGNVVVTIVGTNFKDIPLNGITLQSTTNTGVSALLQNVVVNGTFTTISAIVPPGLPLGSYNLIITSTSHGTKNFGAVYTVGTGQSTTMLIVDVRSQPGNQSPAHGPLAGGTTVTLTADLTAPSPAGFVGNINVTLIFPNGSVLTGGNIAVATSFGTMTFTTPAGPAGFFGGPVTIRVDSSTQGFAIANNAFTYDPTSTTPMINSIAPALGPQGGGTLVTMQGVNFKTGAVSNVRRVLVGGTPALGLAVQSSTQLQFTTPPGLTGPQPVIVESTTGLLSNSVNFTYQQAIVITRLNPNNGPVAGGNSVTVFGQNFTTATVPAGSITIGGVTLANITVVNSGTVTGIVPKGTTEGPVDVVVASNGGLPGMTLRLGYTYGPSFDLPINRGGDDPVSLGVPQGTAVALALGDLVSGSLDAVTANGTNNSITIVPAVASLASNTVPIVIASGSATIGGAVLNNPTDVKAVNLFSASGAQDLVILNSGAQNILVLQNNGNGTFTLRATLTVSSLPSFAGLTAVSIDVGDLNGDGHSDIAVLGSAPAAQNGIGVFLGTATPGTFTPSATFNPIGATEFGAIKLRIIGARGFLVNPFAASVPVDMNSDGIPDIVTLCKTTGTASVLTGKGDGTFTLAGTTSVGAANPISFDVADVDDSGTLDIVTANQGNGTNGSISVLLGNGAGALALFANYGVPGFAAANFQSVVIGDVNFDCRADVVVANYGGSNLSVFIGNGDGSFSTPVQYEAESSSLAPSATVVAIAAIQQTNGLGAVVCVDQQTNGGTNSYVSMVPRHVVDAYLGGFQATNPIFTGNTQGTQPQSVAYGDLNGDGRMDMVVCNRASNTVEVFIGDGFGNFSQPFAAIPLNAGAQPESVLIARVDNTSGSPSVLVACNGLNAVALLRNFGGGSLGNPIYIPVDGTGPHQVLVNDMNGDGKADLITVNQASNNVTILLGDGTGKFARATHSPYPVGNGPLGAAIGDLDGAGLLDIAVCNFASDDVTVLLNSVATATDVQFTFSTVALGGTIFTNPTVAKTGATSVTRGTIEPRSIAIGDLNGDGASDIVTADGNTGTCTILYGKVRATLTMSSTAGVLVGDTLTGPPIGVALGNTPAVKFSYSCRVVAAPVGNTVVVDTITGGGIPQSGDAQFGKRPLSSLIPGVFFAGDPLSKGASLVGTVTGVSNVHATGTFFKPSDYLSDGTTTNVGNPSVILPVGLNPSVVKLFDMNNDGFLDIVVGLQDGSSVETFINQAEANRLVFGSTGLFQTAHNTPGFGCPQLNPGNTLVGLPLQCVCPAGEFTFMAADSVVYGLPDFPANPHNGYPVRLIAKPPVGSGAPAKFAQVTPGHVLNLDIAHVTLDCPPSVAVVSDDNFVRVYKAN